MVCFSHNSLSEHLEFIFHFSDLSSSSYSTLTVDAHSPAALACAKVIAETYTLGLDSCRGHNSHTLLLWLHTKTPADPPAGCACSCIPAPAGCCQDFKPKTNEHSQVCEGLGNARLPRVTGDTFFVLLQPSSFLTVPASVFIKGVAALWFVKSNYFIYSGSPTGASSHRVGSFDNTKKENVPLWSVAG